MKVSVNDLLGEFRGKPCTLDGKQAVVQLAVGHARVSQVPYGLSIPFSWKAVVRIMRKDGAFKSGGGK